MHTHSVSEIYKRYSRLFSDLTLLSLDIYSGTGARVGWMEVLSMVVVHTSVGEVILGEKPVIFTNQPSSILRMYFPCYLLSPCLHRAHVHIWDLLVLKGVTCSQEMDL